MTSACASPSATQSPAATPAQTPTAAQSAPATEAPTPESSTAPTPTASTAAARPVFASVEDAYRQTLTWVDCSEIGVEGQCTIVYVPTDYEHPDTGTTAIAVANFKATSGTPQGKLLVNPGGPGAGGISTAAVLTISAPTLAAQYDLIGFDPRGTGQSDPLQCLATAQLDQLNAFDPTPETDQETQEGRDLVTAQGRACEANSGLLASHVTTIETARDMDVIRALLGDDKLDYLGFSYGTFLGTTYAALFPEKVGRMVLDGAMKPGVSGVEQASIQAGGIETGFTAYVEDCIQNGVAAPGDPLSTPSASGAPQPTAAPCPLGSTVEEAKANARQILETADTQPLTTDDPERPLTQALAFYGMIAPLYDASSWPQLSYALKAALEGQGQPLLTLADGYYQRSDGRYVNNQAQANSAINCLDYQISDASNDIPESVFTTNSPTFGDLSYGIADRGCGDWPLDPDLQAPDYRANGSPPILVVGTTRDPATPYAWAQELAQTLDQGVLLTRDGDGHTAYQSGNQCIRDAVDAFFIDGTVPADGTQC